MVKPKGLLTNEEKADIIEDLDSDLIVYRETLVDYERWNENKQDSFMSEFNQKECDDVIARLKKKIESTIVLKEKIRNL